MTEQKGKRLRLPAGLLGMLLLCPPVEIWIAGHTPGWAHTIVLDWRNVGEASVRETKDCSFLAFGSSMVKFGTLPTVIEARSGRRGYNLSLLNGPPPASYFLFKRALDAGATPQAVVVDFDHNRLEAPPSSPQFNYPWAELLRPDEAFDLALRARDPALFARMMLSDALPSVARRHEVRAGVLAHLNGYPWSLDTIAAAFGTKPAFARNRRVNRGAVANIRRAPTERVIQNVGDVRTSDWHLDPVNSHYVRKFLALARSHGITVYWLIPPVAPWQLADYDRVHALDHYLDSVRRIVAADSNARVLDGLGSHYPGTVFNDHVHLNANGAIVLSASIARVLADASKPGPWIPLPDYDANLLTDVVEDIGRSELILKEEIAATAQK